MAVKCKRKLDVEWEFSKKLFPQKLIYSGNQLQLVSL